MKKVSILIAIVTATMLSACMEQPAGIVQVTVTRFVTADELAAAEKAAQEQQQK